MQSVGAVEATPGDNQQHMVEPVALSVMDVQEIVTQEVEKVRRELIATMQEVVTQEVEKVRGDLMATVQALETQVTELSSRLSAIENKR